MEDCPKHILCRDAAALAHFWAWLEEEVHKNENLTEVDVADRLLEFRSLQDGFMDTSFDTISGIGYCHPCCFGDFFSIQSQYSFSG